MLDSLDMDNQVTLSTEFLAWTASLDDFFLPDSTKPKAIVEEKDDEDDGPDRISKDPESSSSLGAIPKKERRISSTNDQENAPDCLTGDTESNQESPEHRPQSRQRFENYSGVELTLASENFQRLVEIMPEVDPDYLEKVAAKLARSHRYNKVGLGNWIMENVGNPELPKKLDVETVAASVFQDENVESSVCQCCFDDGMRVDSSVICPEGHTFCQECVFRGVQVALGEGKVYLQCLADCQANFARETLVEVLPEDLSEKWSSNLLEFEIGMANIEGLQKCPFCPYAVIDVGPNQIFVCQNPRCKKSSCTICKFENHYPSPCRELELASHARQFVEEAMSEALIRRCGRCGVPYVKKDGCHHVTCSNCGCPNCYDCGKAIANNDHLNCNSTTEKLHLFDILQSAEEAKKTLESSGIHLVIDPSANFTI